MNHGSSGGRRTLAFSPSVATPKPGSVPVPSVEAGTVVLLELGIGRLLHGDRSLDIALLLVLGRGGWRRRRRWESGRLGLLWSLPAASDL